MKSKGWILLLVLGTAWAQTPLTANVPEQTFEQTKPPEWNGPSDPPPASTADPGPEMTKILQVQAELDKADTSAALPPIAVAPEREPSMVHNALRASATLCLVLALILVLAYVVKRVGKRTPLLAGSNLAQVLGKVYLAPRVCLYFVRAGGRVLVVGVAQNAMATIAEFDEMAFDTAARAAHDEGATKTKEPNADALLASLKTSFQDILKSETAPRSEDEDVAALRKDIQRLQQYLEESASTRRD